MANRGNTGIRKLASTLDKRMGEHQEGKFDPDFGTIKEDMSLVLDTFSMPIAAEDYSVCRMATGPVLSGGQHDGHRLENNDGSHTHRLPYLKPGDRVLVIWANNEPVVVDVIMQGGSI